MATIPNFTLVSSKIHTSLTLYSRIASIVYAQNLTISIRRGHFEVVKWLVENGCTMKPYVLSDGAISGNLELCAWLARNVNSPTYDFTLISSNINVIKWFFERGCKQSYSVATLASRGNLEDLKWLISNGYDWDDSTCN